MLQNLIKSLLIKGAKSLLIKIIGVLFAILTSIILARNLSLNDYGEYSFSLNILNILVVLSVYGIDQFIMKEYSLKDQNFDNQISNLSYQSAKRSLLLIIILCVGSFVSKEILKRDLHFLLLVIISAPIKSTAIILGSYINSKGKTVLSIIVKESLFYIIFAILLLALKMIPNENIINLTLVNILYLSIMSLSLMLSMRFSNFGFRLNKVLFRKPKLLPYFINNLSSTIKLSIPVLLIGILLSSEEVALFSIPAQIMIGFTVLFNIMGTTFSPKISSMLRDEKYLEVRQLNKNSITVIGSIALIGFVLITVYGKQILHIWGEEYAISSYPILLILASGQLVNIFTGFNGLILLFAGKIKILNYITISSLFITPLIIIFSIKLFGIIGASLSVSASIILENAIKYICVKKMVWKNV